MKSLWNCVGPGLEEEQNWWLVISAGCILGFPELSSPRVELEPAEHLGITARLDWCCKPAVGSLSQHWWDAQLWSGLGCRCSEEDECCCFPAGWCFVLVTNTAMGGDLRGGRAWCLAVFLGHTATQEMGAGGRFNEAGLRVSLVAFMCKPKSQEISWQ